MKYIFLLLILIGCADPETYTIFKLAKSNPDQKICFNLTSNDGKIDGNFCVSYEGPKK